MLGFSWQFRPITILFNIIKWTYIYNYIILYIYIHINSAPTLSRVLTFNLTVSWCVLLGRISTDMSENCLALNKRMNFHELSSIWNPETFNEPRTLECTSTQDSHKKAPAMRDQLIPCRESFGSSTMNLRDDAWQKPTLPSGNLT